MHMPRERLYKERQQERNSGNNRARMAPPPAQQPVDDARPNGYDQPGANVVTQPSGDGRLGELQKSGIRVAAEESSRFFEPDDEGLGIESEHAGDFSDHSAKDGREL